MRNNTLLVLATLACCLAVPLSAPAAAAGAAVFSFDLPAGFAVSGDDSYPCVPASLSGKNFAPGELTILKNESTAECVLLVVQRRPKGDLAGLVKKIAEDASITMLGKGQGCIYEEESAPPSRSWAIITDDGFFFALRQNYPFKGIKSLIKNLRAKPGQPGVEKALAALESKKALDWLTYATESAVLDDGSRKYFTGDGIYALLPKGWTAEEKGGVATFRPAKGKQFVSVERLALRNEEECQAAAEKEAKRLGRGDSEVDSSNVYFKTRDGTTVCFTCNRAPRTVRITSKGGGDAVNELLGSIENQ